MANRDRIEQVFDRITAETLDMGSWAAAKEDPTVNASCGTTMCFAGHAVVAAGKTLKWEPRWDYKRDENENIFCDPETGEYVREIKGYTADFTTDGEAIETFAAEWLDLDYDDADRIFFATGIRDVELLRNHVNTVIDGFPSYSTYELEHDGYGDC